MDNVNRTDDSVALGHAAMWDAIIAAGSDTCDITTFIGTVVSLNPNAIRDIYKILDKEYIPHGELPTQARWTIMFYICGSTLESGSASNSSSNISRAINNILALPYKPSDYNVIIETGGCTHWSNSVIPNNQNSRYYVSHSQLNPDETGAAFDRNASMGSESTFESFLRWGLTYYPADKTGIVLMNHGGAMSGVCFDSVHNDDSLTNAEVKQAFRNVLGDNPSEKLEFIAYDACLMGVQDVVYSNSKYFKYMAASEDEVNECLVTGTSAQWLSDLYQNFDTLYALKQMGRDFLRNGADWEQTYTVFNLSLMESYRNDFEILATKVGETIRDQYDLESLCSIGEQDSFPHCSNTVNIGKYHIADCYRFLNGLKNQWYASQYITPYIDQVLSYFPDPEQYDINWGASYVNVELTDSGIIAYHVSSLGYSGSSPIMHGLSLHFRYYDEDRGCYLSADETDFNNWRNLFLTQY